MRERVRIPGPIPRSETPGPSPLLRRRAVLAAAVASAASVAAGCRFEGDQSPARRAPPSSATARQVAADVALVVAAIADEERLLDVCMAASERLSTLPASPASRELAGVIERQRQHVARLRSSLVRDRVPPVRLHPQVPHHAAVLLRRVGELAAATGVRREADCLAASSGLLAQLFGSTAASHASTAALLLGRSASPSVQTPSDVSDTAPLQPCLAAEHAAVFGYGVVGGAVDAGMSTAPVAVAAQSSYDVHRERRDALMALITAAGARPVVAEPFYDMPFPVTGVASARRLARFLEGRCAAVYAHATGGANGATRQLTSATLVDCAVRDVTWGSEPAAFPGLD